MQILERDNFSCKLCGNTKLRLDIHHHLYEPDKEPWEYSDDVLETYCKKCHTVVEFIKKSTPKLSVVRILYKSLNNKDVVYVISMVDDSPVLAVYFYHNNNDIEFAVHIPSTVVKIFYPLTNIQTVNG